MGNVHNARWFLLPTLTLGLGLGMLVERHLNGKADVYITHRFGHVSCNVRMSRAGDERTIYSISMADDDGHGVQTTGNIPVEATP